MQNDVYDYTQPAGTSAVRKTPGAARKTYGLLGLSFIPCAAGAFFEAAKPASIFTPCSATAGLPSA